MPETTADHRLRTLRVDDVMNHDVIQVSASATMDETAETFHQHDISSAPVVDDQGTCVGMVSAADFLKRGLHPAAGQSESSSGELVRSFMSEGVQSIGPDEPMLKAAAIMCATHLHHLPVLDDDQRLIGVISTMDITAAVVNAIDEMDGEFLKRHLIDDGG